jgi:hypothetical protein
LPQRTDAPAPSLVSLFVQRVIWECRVNKVHRDAHATLDGLTCDGMTPVSGDIVHERIDAR